MREQHQREKKTISRQQDHEKCTKKNKLRRDRKKGRKKNLRYIECHIYHDDVNWMVRQLLNTCKTCLTET